MRISLGTDRHQWPYNICVPVKKKNGEKLFNKYGRCSQGRLGFQPLESRHSPHLTAGQMVFPIVMINQSYSSPSKFEGHILQIIIAEHSIN